MDYSSYEEGWKRRWSRQAEADRAAAVRALATARRLAQVLRERHGVLRVVLVGSLARGEFREISDIDLGVEGLDDTVFFRVGAELERLAGGFRVDLVPLESADLAFRKAAEKDGVELT